MPIKTNITYKTVLCSALTKVCTWVTQLLVHRFYRGRHIATKLLQSAWGFSNYYAWGLATANTVTIKTLEAVTWRQVSAEQLNEAYSRMDMKNQPWTRHTAKEIDYIEKACGLRGGERVLDVGCGFGRHSIELAKRQYNVVGVDLSEALITQARANVGDLPVTFDIRDCRHLSYRGTFDAIICLYDVIGSYRTYEDNENIVKSIYKKLKSGGMAVVSVMNMDLTKSIAIVKESIRNNPGILLKLKASNIMQSTGNVFNPDYFILDEDEHLVYRKEQFERDNLLSAEYLVADYRFTKTEIETMFKDNCFSIIDSRYVQAGQWDVPLSATDKNAKEILLVVRKN